jgi:hypothetical protein
MRGHLTPYSKEMDQRASRARLDGFLAGCGTLLLLLDDPELCFSGLTLGRGSRRICRWCWTVPLMDLRLYIEKWLSSSAGRGPGRGWRIGNSPSYWTMCRFSGEPRKYRWELRICMRCLLLPWSWKAESGRNTTKVTFNIVLYRQMSDTFSAS